METRMNLHELQAELRHFAAERDWQPFHTPKNLSTALMVEAAELAEIFQWQTPEESRLAHEDTAAEQRIAGNPPPTCYRWRTTARSMSGRRFGISCRRTRSARDILPVESNGVSS